MGLTLICALVVGFAVFMYVLLDGFDLGVGILFLLNPRSEDRDDMMNSITPFWDGNETWLVFGGVTLFGAFPIAYAILLPALYLPAMIMLFALVFRGVAFEYRFKSSGSRRWWDLSFGAGAIVAAFAQGVMLGTIVGGIKFEGRDFAGGAFDWLSPFTLMCGFGVTAGYALLGATWLVMKTERQLHERARGIALGLMPVVVLFLSIVAIWSPLEHPLIAQRWFAFSESLLSLALSAAGGHCNICLVARTCARRGAITIPAHDRDILTWISGSRTEPLSLCGPVRPHDMGGCGVAAIAEVSACGNRVHAAGCAYLYGL